jgi:hypothetical protein
MGGVLHNSTLVCTAVGDTFPKSGASIYVQMNAASSLNQALDYALKHQTRRLQAARIALPSYATGFSLLSNRDL